MTILTYKKRIYPLGSNYKYNFDTTSAIILGEKPVSEFVIVEWGGRASNSTFYGFLVYKVETSESKITGIKKDIYWDVAMSGRHSDRNKPFYLAKRLESQIISSKEKSMNLGKDSFATNFIEKGTICALATNRDFITSIKKFTELYTVVYGADNFEKDKNNTRKIKEFLEDTVYLQKKFHPYTFAVKDAFHTKLQETLKSKRIHLDEKYFVIL